MEWKYVLPKKFEVSEGEEKKMVDSPFKGEITLKLPGHIERIRVAKEISYRLNDKTGEMVKRDEYDSAQALMEAVSKQVVAVNVSRIDDSYTFDSIDALGFDEDSSLVLNELGKMLMRGVRLGKPFVAP
jgi:hypothetical protein